MKRFRLFLMVIGLMFGMGSISAQQIQGDFDQTWVKNSPWDSKNGNYTKLDYIQPVDWIASNVSGMSGTGATQVVFQETTGQGTASPNYSVKLVNKANPYMSSQIVPAYISLGTTWATAVATLAMKVSNADGGSFGGKDFTYSPDAVRLWYKRSHGTANSGERASVIAYFWKGTYTQANVPGNTALKIGTKDPTTTVTMEDRDRNILGKTTTLGGAVTPSEDAALIASVEHYIEGDAPDWTECIAELDYGTYKNTDIKPEKLNIIISANDYFGDRSTIGVDNTLFVDNVELVYYHALSSLVYEGETLDFNTNTLHYDLSNVAYNQANISYVKKGQGAKVTTDYDNSTGLLTVRVEGEDYSINPESLTNYTIQFAKPVNPIITSVSISGENFADFDSATKEYTLPYAYSPGIVISGIAADGYTVEEAVYDNKAKTITLNVTDGTATASYVFNFTEAVVNNLSGEYAGALSVVLTTTDGDQPTPLANAPIKITSNENGTINLILNDFSFFGGVINVGDIFVSNVPISNNIIDRTIRTIRITAYNEDGTPNEGAYGWMLGNLPVAVSATVLDADSKHIEASIDIITAETGLGMMFENIHVDFEPYVIAEEPIVDDYEGSSYTSMTLSGHVTKKGASILHAGLRKPMTFIDMSGAIVDNDVTLAGIMTAAPEANNTLVYVSENSSISGNNVVIGDQASNIVLTDKVAFGAPKAFMAAAISYTRDCPIDGSWETIILPFVPASVVAEGEAGYKIEEYLDMEPESNITFEEKKTWTANTPYLFNATDNSGATGDTKVFTFTGSGDITVTESSYGTNFIGVYSNVALAENEGYLLNANGGNFALCGASSSVLPFRAYLTASATDPASSITVIHKDPTSIDENPDRSDLIYAVGNAVIVKIAKAQTVVVNDLAGRTVRVVEVAEGTTVISGLTAGFYIVNGQKVLIK